MPLLSTSTVLPTVFWRVDVLTLHVLVRLCGVQRAAIVAFAAVAIASALPSPPPAFHATVRRRRPSARSSRIISSLCVIVLSCRRRCVWPRVW